MKLQRAEIHDFRNHRASVLDFTGGMNAIFGDNGEGKTNIVEAISYLCLTKSFYASNDAHVVRIGGGGFDVRGTFQADNGTEWLVTAGYDVSSPKKKRCGKKTTGRTRSPHFRP